MDLQTLKLLVCGIVLFGIFAGVPIILGLLSHQQKMAELFAKNSVNTSEVMARLEAMERTLAAIRGAQAPHISGSASPMLSPVDGESMQRVVRS